MTETRVGVIGVGTMGQHHTRVYNELPTAELVGVADADAERAAEIAAEYSTRSFAVDELIDRVDAVTIAVPTKFHYDLARQCIDAGVDLLIEKPIVEDPEHGRALIEAADRAGVTLQVGHIERHNPVVKTLEEIVPDLDVIAFEAERLGPTPDRGILDSAVIDLMIHDIDIVRSLVGSSVESIDAVGAAEGRHATATLAFEEGVVGTLTASRVTQTKTRTLSITAEDCYVTADYIDQSVQIHRQSVPEFVTNNGDVRYRHESVVENPAVDNGEPLKYELRSFIEACANDTEPPVTGEEGLRALEIAREINAAAFGDEQKAVPVMRE
ncbi:Gfo/Idh/MocA family protein [Natronomonas salsuginis]|uniref:Gfo/Idh/MocA family oxidoreductase n=1 Tax=Natronomonas salsuginis TaxID=2217661 RepID=A0A4U5J8P6_9EURY|nr:Gfo/Idh/MocA family oxidoreductase [Natronomonas salsuginis]TKR25452.1 Gfo/Idh/MocA family oxidoreductase [Natronomonas salsuginis]